MNNKFEIIDVTDEIVIGGFGNLEGNLGLLKYNNEEIEQMIKENNNGNDNIRLIESLLGSLKELDQENQELKKQQKEFLEWLENEINICDGFLDAIKSDLEEISYAGRVSGKTYIATQIMKNETAKKCYEEALSKYKEIKKKKKCEK